MCAAQAQLGLWANAWRGDGGVGIGRKIQEVLQNLWMTEIISDKRGKQQAPSLAAKAQLLLGE